MCAMMGNAQIFYICIQNKNRTFSSNMYLSYKGARKKPEMQVFFLLKIEFFLKNILKQ